MSGAPEQSKLGDISVSRPRKSPTLWRGASLAAGAIFLALALLPLLVNALDSEFFLNTITRILIFAIAALALDLILGFGGMVSLGHAAFMGLGAYCVAIAASYGVTDLFVQASIAILVSILFALVTGAVSLRTHDIHFIMITLAFSQMAYFFATSLSAYGGDDGVGLTGRSTLFGSNLLQNNVVFYYLVLLVLIAVFFALRIIIASRFGRVLRGTRDNPVRMEAVGFHGFSYRLTAYAISGAIAGVAGVLLANLTEFVSPSYMHWQRSGELLIMVVLGGMGTLIGAIVGAIGFMLLEEWLAIFTEHWRFGLGVILVLVVLFTRGGITGYIEKYVRRGAEP